MTYYVNPAGYLYHGDPMPGDLPATQEQVAARELAARSEQRVDMAQARLALLQAGHLAAVDAAIAAMPGAEGSAARIEWGYRSTVRRGSPLVQSMAAVLSLTESDLDALFALAATL